MPKEKPVSRMHNQLTVTKSPSDTTLYRPAFEVRQGVNEANETLTPTRQIHRNLGDDMVNKISEFVESIRVESEGREAVAIQDRLPEEIPGFAAARSKTDNTVIQAEKFKATIEQPGNEQVFLDNADANECIVIPDLERRTDDDFFHLTCHIDASLKGKIERSEFVDLEKLLPREESKHDNRLE